MNVFRRGFDMMKRLSLSSPLARRLPSLAAALARGARHSTLTEDPTPAGGWAISEAGRRAASPSLTHIVTNQATALADYNAFTCDPTLIEAIDRTGAGWAAEHLNAFGSQTGSAVWQAAARNANMQPPRLVTHDRFGHRVDRAEYHPAYHQLMRLALESGCAGYAWGEHRGRAGAHVARASLMYLMYQLESGVCCPVTMTFAGVPALAGSSAVASAWVPALSARAYDERDVPLAAKAGGTLGMSMTEKQARDRYSVADTVWSSQCGHYNVPIAALRQHAPPILRAAVARTASTRTVVLTVALRVSALSARRSIGRSHEAPSPPHSTQGGSDVRANTTRATPVSASDAGEGGEYTLVGHKWFTSAPMSDGFLTLAQASPHITHRPDRYRTVTLRLPDVRS